MGMGGFNSDEHYIYYYGQESLRKNEAALMEAKNPALLSSRDGYLLELTGWTYGSQAS